MQFGRQFAPRVTVAVAPPMAEHAERLVGADARVVAGGSTRLETFARLVDGASGRTLVLHDVVDPLSTCDLAERVIAAAGSADAAMAVGTVSDYVIRPDASVAAGPSEVGILQKPIVFPREAALRGLRLLASAEAAPGGRAPAAVEILQLAGVDVRLVAGEPWNVKITDEADWQLVQLLARGVAAGAAPRTGGSSSADA